MTSTSRDPEQRGASRPRRRRRAPRSDAPRSDAPRAAEPSVGVEGSPEDFAGLGLREELLRALSASGYERPTPIQRASIPPALAGRDLICCAQTGTGKTAAFALPILQQLASEPPAPLRALVLVPTRELAVQVADSFRDYGRHLGLSVATVLGGVPMEPQERALKRGADILVATPGRLKDHIWQGNVDFRHTRYLVLDEADRMLDMGFVKAVREIVDLLPGERQSWLFSATLDEAIRRFAGGIVRDPLRVQVAPPSATLDEVDQRLVRTRRAEKLAALEGLIRRERMERAIIFTRTKSGASRLASQLRARGHAAAAIHSDRTQAERMRVLEGFRLGQVGLLVATDVAARGIDVDDVSHVVNYDMPRSPKDYVHRIGRTARAGRRGVALSLVTDEDLPVVAAIERLITRRLSWVGRGGGGGRAPEPAGAESGTRPARSSRRGGERAARERSGGRAAQPAAGPGRSHGARPEESRGRGSGGRPEPSRGRSRDAKPQEGRGRSRSGARTPGPARERRAAEPEAGGFVRGLARKLGLGRKRTRRP